MRRGVARGRPSAATQRAARRPLPRGPGSSPRHRGAALRQVFGLVGGTVTRFARLALLLAVASRPEVGPVRMTAVVPTHRCGAVPDSHRVPCCLLGRVRTRPKNRRGCNHTSRLRRCQDAPRAACGTAAIGPGQRGDDRDEDVVSSMRSGKHPDLEPPAEPTMLVRNRARATSAPQPAVMLGIPGGGIREPACLGTRCDRPPRREPPPCGHRAGRAVSRVRARGTPHLAPRARLPPPQPEVPAVASRPRRRVRGGFCIPIPSVQLPGWLRLPAPMPAPRPVPVVVPVRPRPEPGR